MNQRQQLFVTEYLKDFNATQAAIRAGYSPKTAGVQGHELLKNPKIAPLLAEKGRNVLQRADWDVTRIVARAGEIALQDKPDRVSALALLARRHPEFSEKHDVNVSVRAQVVAMVAAMSDDELRQAKNLLS